MAKSTTNWYGKAHGWPPGRAERVAVMFERAAELAAETGRDGPPETSDPERQWLWLMESRVWKWPGWFWANVFEMSDVYGLYGTVRTDFHPRPASAPTEAKPGSAAKVAVLAARMEAGEDLWHDADTSGLAAGISEREGFLEI